MSITNKDLGKLNFEELFRILNSSGIKNELNPQVDMNPILKYNYKVREEFIII